VRFSGRGERVGKQFGGVNKLFVELAIGGSQRLTGGCRSMDGSKSLLKFLTGFLVNSLKINAVKAQGS